MLVREKESIIILHSIFNSLSQPYNHLWDDKD